MKECLDEARLQSYFDGELSTSMMEKAASHLASCLTCAARARELEQETSLLEAALAPEFEASIPTERLRRRIDAAVSGLHVVRPAVETPNSFANFFRSLGGLLTFLPQRTLGYASLALILAFAALFGLVKFNSRKAPVQQVASTPVSAPATTVARVDVQPEVPSAPATQVQTGTPVAERPTHRAVKKVPVAPQKQEPVKLLPGERTYLQTIAKLDSAIKSEKKAMRPALQVEYERNLAVVDRAIAATRNAAKSNPTDPDAADFMFAAYQSKVDLLNTIADARVGGRSH